MDTEHVTHIGDSSSDRSWKLFNQSVPKSEVVFFVQVFLIYVVVVVSIVNLSINKDDEGKMWTVLLSSCLGYLLPNPTLKKRNT